ncbi:MAG: ribosome maturation factor RimP [Holosporales bacterium]|jgi:ribosome maturation factor RimP|nr:ribosome maturation factor RimP [Holosporales bacterium]
MSVLLEKIERSISGIVAELGCSIVRVQFLNKGKGNKTLQLMIEKKDGSPCNITDCERVSRSVSVSLDVIDCIDGRYDLEVSSAGIDRPLVKTADFARFCGNPVVVRTHGAKNERQLYKGNLEFVSEDGIKVVLNAPLLDGTSVINLRFEEINNAHIDGTRFLKVCSKGERRR